MPPPPYNSDPAVDPEYYYPTSQVSRGSIVGGHVYRGPDPTLQGRYIFYESVRRQVWSYNPATGLAENISHKIFDDDVNNITLAPVPDGIPDDDNNDGRPEINNTNVGLFASFGEDSEGNLYFLSHSDGFIYRITTDNTGGTPGDFNSDGMVNAQDIDLLALAVRPGANPPLPIYDLNDMDGVTFDPHQSGMVLSDSDVLVRNILMTNYGDSDLDDDIDTGDVTDTVLNFNGAGNTGRNWETGDFDGDGDTDTGDVTTVILGFTGAGTGAAIRAALATDWNAPSLVYDARTGEVVVDPGDATILSFSLESDGRFSASADFGELDASVLAGVDSSLVDNTTGQIGWVSVAALAGLGLNSAETIGTILPAGLSDDELSAILDHFWAGPHGTGGLFELVVVPEPSGLLLALLAVLISCMVVSQRQR